MCVAWLQVSSQSPSPTAPPPSPLMYTEQTPQLERCLSLRAPWPIRGCSLHPAIIWLLMMSLLHHAEAVCARPSLRADEETVHESSWQSPSAHSLTLLLEALGLFCCFEVVFGVLLAAFPWASAFWMRAFLLLSTGPCQPAQLCLSPASTTAAAASAKAQSSNHGK